MIITLTTKTPCLTSICPTNLFIVRNCDILLRHSSLTTNTVKKNYTGQLLSWFSCLAQSNLLPFLLLNPPILFSPRLKSKHQTENTQSLTTRICSACTLSFFVIMKREMYPVCHHRLARQSMLVTEGLREFLTVSRIAYLMTVWWKWKYCSS